MSEESKRVIDMNYDEARAFFLKNESYCNSDLPSYFNFSGLLGKISDVIGDDTNFNDLLADKPSGGKDGPKYHDKVNYCIFANKDGKYGWRKLQLIHPILYVYLVNYITKEGNWNRIKQRINDFLQFDEIDCTSWPRMKISGSGKDKSANISGWLRNQEERSLELSLDYKYLFKTDITGCYGSIYTHSILWALYGIERVKQEIKEYHDTKNLFGNEIDQCLRSMNNGQTNGIPEGSTLMDFLAEIVLGYIDSLLYQELERIDLIGNNKFKILRYRDDYHIFVNDPEIGKTIVKTLSSILTTFGMKLNSEKTKFSDNIIRGVIKGDKFERYIRFSNQLTILTKKKGIKQKEVIIGLKKRLLLIDNFSEEFPNSGSITSLLSEFCEKIYDKEIKSHTDIKILISILVDIGFYSPKTYPYLFTSIGILAKQIDDEDTRKNILIKAGEKLKRLPASEYLNLWIQRLKCDVEYDEQEKLCKQYNAKATQEIWDNSRLKNEFKNIIEDCEVVDYDAINKMPNYITQDEVLLFHSNDYY